MYVTRKHFIENIVSQEDIMKPYAEMTKEELLSLRQDLKAQYREFQAKDLKLDMSRGKPCVEQLDLSMGMY